MGVIHFKSKAQKEEQKMSYINQRLAEEGYSLLDEEIIDFIFRESIKLIRLNPHLLREEVIE